MFSLLACALFFLVISSRAGADTSAVVDARGGGTPELSVSDCLSAATEESALLCVGPIAGVDDARTALDVALRRGLFTAAEKVIDAAVAGGWDVTTTLAQRSSAIRKSLSELGERLSATAMSVDIPPSFEYAQSPKFIFISVKWALGRAPSTLGCKPSPPDYSTRNLSFRAVCAEKRKTFVLQLALWGNISAESSSWREASVGRATLTIAKEVEGVWPRLLADQKIKTQLWWFVSLWGAHSAHGTPRALYLTPAPLLIAQGDGRKLRRRE